MSTNRKKLGALLCVAVIGIVAASTAGAAHKASLTLKIGGTFPLSEGPQTGGASLYKTITGAEQAYFGYLNAHGGVDGKIKINDVVKDDQYTPSETVADDKTLVESDKVFAIVGSLGTAPGLATMNYLNNKKVPQVLLATGDAYWGMCSLTGSAFKPVPGVCTKPKTWTMGFQPDYPGESKLYAKRILASVSHPKIGVLYQDDPYGKNYLAGLEKGLGSHKSDICHTEAYSVGESNAQIIGRVGQIQGHGCNVLVIFATPGATIASLIGESVLHYSPSGGTYLNNVSANRVFILAAEQNGAHPDGVVSTTYVKSQSSMSNDSAIKLGHDIIYATGNAGLKHQWDIGDSNLVYGLAVAWTFADAVHKAKLTSVTPTTSNRLKLMKALRSLSESGGNKNPFVYPGMVVKTSSSRTWPMEQLQFEKWNGTSHDWKPFLGVSGSGH